jgi:hypothetical protein
MATKISIRQQMETALHAWLVATFTGFSEFSGVSFSKGQQSGEVELPLVAAICEDAQEVEEPGLGVYNIPASIAVMTTIDEVADPDAEHRARADTISNRLEDFDALRSNLNTSGRVFVFGFGPVKSSHAVVERHFVDKFEVGIFCRCV